MADNIKLITYAGSSVTPQHDAVMANLELPGNGIIYGCDVTIKNATTLHIASGMGVIYGREFEIMDSDITVQLSTTGTLLGQMYVHMDLSNTAEPIQLLVQTGVSLDDLVDDPEVNITAGVSEMQLATFTIDTSTLDNLQETYTVIENLTGDIEEIKANINQINSDLTALTPEAVKWRGFGSAINQEGTAQNYYFGFDGGANVNIYPVPVRTIAYQLWVDCLEGWGNDTWLNLSSGGTCLNTVAVNKSVGVDAGSYYNAQLKAVSPTNSSSASRAMIGFENNGFNGAAIWLQTDATMHYRTNQNVDYQFTTTQVSSRRVKDNIEPIKDEEAKKLLDLDVVSFDYIEKLRTTSSESTRQYGLIAEDVRDILPNCVVVPVDYNEDDESDDVNVLSIKYEKLVPQLLKLIQIQQEQIDELTARVKALESK